MGKKMKILKITALIIFSVTLICAFVFVLLVRIVYKGINFEGDERLFEGARSFHSTTFYANATPESEKYTPIPIEIGGDVQKIRYSLDEISPYLKDGFIAVEDRKFFLHKGIDTKRTLMAAVNYIIRKDKIYGASTITQQLIKNISGDNQISLKRKAEEIIRAIHIERKYSKEEILELYLNVVPMSENIYGVGAASRAYFNKEPSELKAEEAAMLIGLTNAPTAYNPYKNPELSKKKRDIVLSVMHSEGIIDNEEYNKAVITEIDVIPREKRQDRLDSWFVETVICDVSSDLAKKYEVSSSAARMMLLGGGYDVYTTMDPKIQTTLEKYFEDLNNFPKEAKLGLNYAMTVTDARTGYLVGIVGRVGKKNANRIQNHALLPHVPGSTLKPIALYAPLIDEKKINWATVFDDIPIEFYEKDGVIREYPKNSPEVYDGLTTVKDGLRKSKNTLAVRLCAMRTPKKIYESLKEEFLFDTLVEREGSLTDISTAPMALGQLTHGVSLRRLTEAYGTFSADGQWRESCSYICIKDYEGRVILKKEQLTKEIFKPSTARIMNRLLMTVTESGTAKSIKLKNTVNTAGKTGTSGGSKDKTFIGYTPYYNAGIWCGYDGYDKTIPSLEKSHIEIWDEVMTQIHSDVINTPYIEEFSTNGIYLLPYCMDSGKIYTETCVFDPRGNRREYGYFTEDNRPISECDRHVLVKYDYETKAISTEHCPKDNITTVALLNIPNRSFPKEVIITDAEFVYRDIDRYTPRPIDYALPYFQYSLPDGVYAGKSKGKKQFNSNCYLHDE